MNIVAVIPARYGSTRLPGKPLVDIAGKPMVQHVYERVANVVSVDQLVVATDDQRIADAVKAFGGTVMLTPMDCASGSDRVAMVAEAYPADIYVNIQGDEPLVRAGDISTAIDALCRNSDADAASVCYPIDAQLAQQPAIVKVVRDNQDFALYFSRAPIPVNRDGHAMVAYHAHAGMYVYRATTLRAFNQTAPTVLEQAEKLEQLRLLQMGLKMVVPAVRPCAPGVDTPEDLRYVRRIMALDNVRLIVSDIDGIFTDGRLYYGATGESIKVFHALDGVGVKMLQKCGIEVAVLSGRDSPALRTRLAELGVVHFKLGQYEKRQALGALFAETGIGPEHTLYLGDDIPDMEALAICSLGFTVPHAAALVKDAADFVLSTPGGQGAFREAVDMVLRAKELCANA